MMTSSMLYTGAVVQRSNTDWRFGITESYDSASSPMTVWTMLEQCTARATLWAFLGQGSESANAMALKQLLGPISIQHICEQKWQ